jgi:hypothetical protein
MESTVGGLWWTPTVLFANVCQRLPTYVVVPVSVSTVQRGVTIPFPIFGYRLSFLFFSGRSGAVHYHCTLALIPHC